MVCDGGANMNEKHEWSTGESRGGGGGVIGVHRRKGGDQMCTRVCRINKNKKYNFNL